MIQTIRNALGWLIVLGFLGYGLIRIGVGSLLFMQAMGWIDLADFRDVLVEVETFIGDRADRQWFAFSVAGYFAYIASMGVVLTTGAIGVILRKTWGFVLIGLYLLMHAGLFVNFQEINPKLISLALTIVLYLVLLWARPARPAASS